MEIQRESWKLAQFLTDRRREKIDAVLATRIKSIAIVLENLYDPHNISAVLRSAEAIGIQNVYIVETSHSFRLSSGVTRGCEKWLTLHRFTSTAECLAALRAAGYEVAVGDHTPGVPGLEALDPVRKRAYWMGAEHAGLSAEARAAADVRYRLEMYGFTESFNVSVAAAVTLYTARSRWQAATGLRGDLTEAEQEALRMAWLRRDIAAADAILARNDPKRDGLALGNSASTGNTTP